MRLAVLDLGSTSFRLVVVDVDADGNITYRSKKRAALNLGLISGREGKITEPHAVAAAQTLIRFRAQAERSGAERVIPVATSALRDASNREELADRFERTVGCGIRFLSGEEEALLTFAAHRAGLGLSDRTVVGLDLGGGSLEVVVGKGARPVWARSFPLGAARLTGMFVRHDPMTRREHEELQRHVREGLLPVGPAIRIQQPVAWIASGGTVKALARLIAAETGGRDGRIHGLAISRPQLRHVSDRLVTTPRSQRLRLPGIGLHRVDAIATGAIVLAAVADVMGADALTVSEWGLREGIILEALGLTESLMVEPSGRGQLALSR